MLSTQLQAIRKTTNSGLYRQSTPGPGDDSSRTTVVFEFANCLCPGAQMEKLKHRGPEWMKSQSQFQREMFLGGSDRVEMLRKYLKRNVTRNRIRFCIVSDEETKMLILLLQSLDLLRYFVSRNVMLRNHKKKRNGKASSGSQCGSKSKLVSHVVGYDHVIQKGTESKRHLILLKLMQFLHREHEEVLYVSHDQEVLDHIDQIAICKTFEVKTKGLLQSDLDAIRRHHIE